MSKRKRFGVSEALTRGLSDTIHVVENNAGTFRNAVLPLSRIELDPDNPRKLAVTIIDVQKGVQKSDPQYERKLNEFEKLRELANTIESSGIINPIVVYKRGEVYRVVAGERRCLASFLAGKNEIEGRVFNEKPKGFDLKLIQWIENTAREDLTLDERINNIREIIQEYILQHGTTDITATLIKNIIGLSLPQATYYLAVMNAPADLKELIVNGQIRSLDKAAIIAGIESDQLRKEAIQACLSGYSLKELRKIISREKFILQQPAFIPNQRQRADITRINLGFTMRPDVIHTLVQSVLNQVEFRKYSDIFSKVDWNHFEQASRAFKKLIEILEHEKLR